MIESSLSCLHTSLVAPVPVKHGADVAEGLSEAATLVALPTHRLPLEPALAGTLLTQRRRNTHCTHVTTIVYTEYEGSKIVSSWEADYNSNTFFLNFRLNKLTDIVI